MTGAADAQAALGMLEVLQASQHHRESKLAQAWWGDLEQEQGCPPSRCQTPASTHTNKRQNSFLIKNRGIFPKKRFLMLWLIEH